MANYGYGGTFDLGSALSTAENVLASRQNRRLKEQAYLRQLEQDRINQQNALIAQQNAERAAAMKQMQFNTEQEAAQRAAFMKEQKFTAEQQAKNTQLLYKAASEVEANPGSVDYYLPLLKRAGIINSKFELQNVSPEQISAEAGALRRRLEPVIQRESNIGKTEQYGMSPIGLVGPTGEYTVGQLTSTGRVVPSRTPEGYRAAEPQRVLDVGPEYRLVGTKTGEAKQSYQKGLAPTEEQSYIVEKKASEEAGKQKGQAKFNLGKSKDAARFMLDTIDQQLNDPGTKYITGKYSLAPIIPGSDQARAFSRHEQIQGKVFLQAYQTLRGGGQITEVEGQKAEAAIARLNRSQSTGDYKSALKELADVVRAALKRSKEQAGEQPSAKKPIKSLSDEELLRLLK
jgi:hypothetical protein